MNANKRRALQRRCAALTLMAWLTTAGANASFTIVNMDDPSEGLNDATPFTPVGGNNATTLGEARLNVLQEAVRIWGLQITSAVPIVIDAEFNPLTCTASSGTLGSAGPRTYFANSAGSNALPLNNVLYPAALARAIAGPNTINSQTHDIHAQFNSKVNADPTCVAGRSFYLGLNHANGSNIDLLNVMLHEIGHGLGFVSLVDQSGASVDQPSDRLTPYDQFVFSETQQLAWPAMTDAQRASSETSNGKLVWNSPSVNARLAKLAGGLSNPGGHLRLYAPTTYSDGSSVSHWDTPASPNLLMEPFITANPNGLTDLTTCVLLDIGWPGAHCGDTKVALAQTISATEDTPIQFTLQGVDEFGNVSSALTFSIVGSPTLGTLSTPASMTSSTGVTYTFMPGADLNGQDGLSFQVSDGTDSSFAATVRINIAAVNDAPVAKAQSLSVVAGVATPMTLAATDVDSPTLSYTITATPANGTLTGTAPNLTYTSASGFSGTDSFSFRANDGSLDSNAATVTIAVTSPAPAVTSSVDGGKGGGGGIDWLALVSLSLLALCNCYRQMLRPSAIRIGASGQTKP